MRPLRATYRVQFNAEFTFADAADLVPYWARLGVSHLYASPVFTSRKGSTHGYDIVDHGAINPVLGGEDGLRRLSAKLQEAQMGLILDIVPNHSGIGGDQNKFWLDLLEFGPKSCSTSFFDVDWRDGKILVPFLGCTIGEALADHKLLPEWHATFGRLALRYEDHLLPLSPITICRHLVELAGPSQHGDLCSLAVDWLSHHEGKRTATSLSDLRRRLREVVNTADRSKQLLERIDAELRDDTSDPSPQKRLLDEQYWRLAHWRTAREELNYRRFFSIADLAAIRIEDNDVFRAVHALPLRLLADGVIDGLRVDHIDGLADPAAYCAKLRNAVGSSGTIHVEKILGAEEELRAWPIEGTTGYETLNLINGLFIEPGGYAKLANYALATGAVPGLEHPRDRVAAAKRQMLEESFVSELNQLAGVAKHLADRTLATRDLTEETLKRALTELLVAFPVYRSYLSSEPADIRDRTLIDAVATPFQENAETWQRTAFEFLRTALLSNDPNALILKTRFQHLSSPLMAKGYEDTELYRYIVLVSANEVGSHVDAPAVDTQLFHRRAAQQLADWPQALIPLATHDTKRGADMRARLNVLSECSEAWIEATQEWSSLNHRFRSDDTGRAIPSAADEMLIYQTLVGAWPIDADRVLAYMQKAIREARLYSSWEAPDTGYEQGVEAFIRSILEGAEGADFRGRLTRFIEPLVRAAQVNTLAQKIVQFTMPGVPDIYWGGEFSDFTLVDPDNRRPVNWTARRQALDRQTQDRLSLVDIDDRGETKQAVIARLLALRRECPELFRSGGYMPLEFGNDVDPPQFLSFARTQGNDGLITIVPIRAAADPAAHTLLLPDEWVGRTVENIFDSTPIELTQSMPLSRLLKDQPVAVLRSPRNV
jgi:(1->4)-alpha-D-glucan 1-alpha-D-glucosylmutase